MPSKLTLLASALFLQIGTGSPAMAQTVHLGAPDLVAGYVEVLRDHAPWPSPDVLVRHLQSSNDQVRLEALFKLGLTEGQAHRQKWSQGAAAKVIGEDVVTPDQIRLTYAPLGSDATEEAILAIKVANSIFVAIGIPVGDRWQRIAYSNCWCKYDMSTGEDALSEFIRLVPAPDLEPASSEHYELVVHASGGGTGIYSQNEAHFRLQDGELRTVLSFVSRLRSCVPTGPEPHFCVLTRRWFYWTNSEDAPTRRVGILVEARGRFSSDTETSASWFVRDLELRHLQTTHCTSYQWNQRLFRYERLTPPSTACRRDLH